MTGSIVLVHGAGSGPWAFEHWHEAFDGVRVEAVDLQAGLNVAEAAMSNYAAVVARAGDGLPRPLTVCGWSMGGLVAMLAAREAGAERLVLIEPSPPGEIQGFDAGVELDSGTFDPEETYGPFPPGVRARPESRLARAERKRGIAVPSLPCPALVVYGGDYTDERGQAIAGFYGAEELELAGLDHWGLVRDGRAPREVASALWRSSGTSRTMR